MKIKERESEKIFVNFKKVLVFLFKMLVNKFTKRLILVILLLFLFISGMVLGLVLSGYFGTFDQPSGRAYAVLTYLGIGNLHELKVFTEGLLKENIKIPYYYIKSQFSSPERLTIDIGFKDYQEIEYKRQQAMELGTLISSGDDYVPAKITYQGKEYDVKLRLKGDLEDHWSGEKWSLRIKVDGDNTIMGMKVFSIQDPKTRQELNEMIYQNALKLAGVIGLRYKFVEVVINGENKGIYALEEHFSKELVENNNRREGVILKFDESLSFENSAINDELSFSNRSFGLVQPFYGSPVITFDNPEDMVNDSLVMSQFEKGKNLLEGVRRGTIKPSQAFDVEKTAKYYAISTLMNCPHSQAWHNVRVYYNPITSKLEPIGFDGNCRRDGAQVALMDYLPDCIYIDRVTSDCSFYLADFSDLVLSDGLIYKEYVKYLNEYSDKEYLDNLFSELDSEIKQDLTVMHKDNPFYYFSKDPSYRSQEQIKILLDPLQGVNAYLINETDSTITISVENINPLPLEIVSINVSNQILELDQDDYLVQPWNLSGLPVYKEFRFKKSNYFKLDSVSSSHIIFNYRVYGLDKVRNVTVFPWSEFDSNFSEEDFIRKEVILSDFDFLEVNEDNKIITIKQGKWTLNSDLIIPKGYSLVANSGTEIDLVNNSIIISYSNVIFRGSETSPIKLFSSDKTGQGFVILNAYGKSSFKNVIFSDLTTPKKEGWELTTPVSFNEITFSMENVVFSNIQSEDSFNSFSSNFEMKNVTFLNCAFDCFDGDFNKGRLVDSTFKNCGNDCIDFSGSDISIDNINLYNVGDKGISAGEKSNLTVSNVIIGGKVNIGIASKDLSRVLLDNATISGAKYAFALYQKKPEYGPSKINSTNVNIISSERDYIVEKNSEFLLNNIIVLGTEKDVYKSLYGDE